jgi:non-homologous end joining protein Ku
MIILKIKEPGYTVNIPGFKEIKTPFELDITKSNLNNIIVYLRKSGVTNYEIKSSSKGTQKLEQKKEEEKIIETITNVIHVKEDNSELKDKINNIENLLDRLIKTKIQSFEVIENKSKKDIDIEDNFIPSIETDSLTTKGNFSQTTSKMDRDDNVLESANLLKSLRNKI